jgi:acetyl esterase/lipase
MNGFRAPRLSVRVRALSAAALALLLVVVGCRVTDWALWGLPEPLPADAIEVEAIRGVAYYDGPGADDCRHRLDLFLPRGRTDFPVVVLVHGGAWVAGDNRCCGLYSSVGEFLASRGIGAVLPNYRLSPEVRHPEHARDVARAVAWTRDHIASHGGNPDQLFLAGHSAGGHLAALLATDASYLEARGVKLKDIRGVMAVSGVYHLPPGELQATVGGDTSQALRLDEMAPLRGGGRVWPGLGWPPGIPIGLNVFDLPFGHDPRVRATASPLFHVRAGLPPFLLCYADNDLPTLGDMAEEFGQALRSAGVEVSVRRVAERNHHSIIFRAIEPTDPVGGALVDFVRRHAGSTAQAAEPSFATSR